MGSKMAPFPGKINHTTVRWKHQSKAKISHVPFLLLAQPLKKRKLENGTTNTAHLPLLAACHRTCLGLRRAVRGRPPATPDNEELINGIIRALRQPHVDRSQISTVIADSAFEICVEL